MTTKNNINISYSELKEITNRRLLNRINMKEKAEQPYDYAKFHAQGQAILDMWYDIVLVGKAPSEQVESDWVYFNNILQSPRF